MITENVKVINTDSRKLQHLVKDVPVDLHTDKIRFNLNESQFKELLLQDEDARLYKCQSKDSLSSLQQLAYTTGRVVNAKKYIMDDQSSYDIPATIRNDFYNESTITDMPFLKPRMSFTGYQISGYKKYQVTVTLKTVNFPKLNEDVTDIPHMTGFLTIKGLTMDYPEITTFFESYAVTDNNFGFFSSSWMKSKDFTSNDLIDLEHWLNFPAYKQLSLDNKDRNCIKEYINQRYVFMRWKEKFMIPDAFTDGVAGASYDGFYYIVHDQFTGTIQGFYYHKHAEKFQQLELVPCTSSIMDTASNCSFEFA